MGEALQATYDRYDPAIVSEESMQAIIQAGISEDTARFCFGRIVACIAIVPVKKNNVDIHPGIIQTAKLKSLPLVMQELFNRVEGHSEAERIAVIKEWFGESLLTVANILIKYWGSK